MLFKEKQLDGYKALRVKLGVCCLCNCAVCVRLFCVHVYYMRGFPFLFFHVFLCVFVCANLHFNLILLTLLHYLLDLNVG